ncbi:MAG TPA: PD-(D/E)XK nuclease family protein, partial [Solirubrobacteraceae bacterium]
AVRIGRPENWAEQDAAAVALRGADPPPGAVAPAEAEVAAAPPAGTAPPVSTVSYSSLGEYARCGYRFYAERVLGLPPVPETRPPSEPPAGPRSAADRGVLLHAVLERLDFRRPVVPDRDAIAAAAVRARLSPPPGPAEADELAALIRRFAATELCGRLGRATNVRREERFAFPAADGVLVVGAVDVLARESDPAHPGRALVVDYKSDRLTALTPPMVVEAEYATQRLVYALAALRTGADGVQVAYCFLEAPDAPVVAEYHRSQAAELEAALGQVSRGVLDREFTVSPAPHRGICGGCPAEGGLCSWPLEMTRRDSPDRLF